MDLAPFFEPAGDAWVASPTARGTWDERSAHFGPPAALLGRAMEQAGDDTSGRFSRVSIEVLSPVPLGVPLAVEAGVVRPGRRVSLLEASMTTPDGRVLALARGWRFRRADPPLTLPPVATGSAAPAMPGPDGLERSFLFTSPELPGYHLGTEWRFLTSGIAEPGPGRAWCRMRVPLVPDEDPTPLQRLLAAADSGNGVSNVADPRELLFVNTDLTVHLLRDVVGEWVGLDAVTVLDPVGGGVATSVLHDLGGPVGNGAQALFVDAVASD